MRNTIKNIGTINLVGIAIVLTINLVGIVIMSTVNVPLIVALTIKVLNTQNIIF